MVWVVFVVALVASAATTATGAAGGRATRPRVGSEVPVTAEDLRVQAANNSPMVVADPTEGRFLALANRLDGPDFSCALQLSGDDGQTWVPARPVPRLPPGAEKCYGPEVAFDADGRLYYLFVGLRGRGNAPMGVFLTTSTDRGRTFSTPRQVLGPRNFQVRMAIDRSVGSTGRLHLVWLQVSSELSLGGLPPSDNPIVTAHSDDGGKTFSKPVRVIPPELRRAAAPALALGADKHVYVAYYDLQQDAVDYQGLEGPTWQGTWSMVVSSSTDGGQSFRRRVVVNDAIRPPGRVMLIYTMPPPGLAAGGRQRPYVAWTDGRNGDWDVFLSRSANAGRSWAKPARLNDDPVRNGRHQYLPHLSVAPNGRLDAIFYDRRRDRHNVRNDVSYTFSTDGGRRFSPNRLLTAESSDSRVGQRYLVPSAKGMVEFGSRLALLSRDREGLAAWTDTRNTRGGEEIAQSIFSRRLHYPAAESPAERGVPIWAVLIVSLGGLAAVGAGIKGIRTWRRRQASPALR